MKEKNFLFSTYFSCQISTTAHSYGTCVAPQILVKWKKFKNGALRFVYNDSLSSYATLLQHAKKPSLYLSRLRKLSLEVHKILTHQSPSFLNDLFVMKDSAYNLRDNVKVHQPVFNTMTFGRNSLRYQGAKLWNLLPIEIKKATNVKQFRNLIKTWLGPSCNCAMCVLCKTRT